MPQELVPQANSTMGAFQQSRNLHHYEILPIMSNHAQDRLDGSKWIVRHLGFGRRATGDQSGLSRIGFGQQPYVSQQLQLQPQHGEFTLATGLRQHRLLVGG